jgi:predicted kinase
MLVRLNHENGPAPVSPRYAAAPRPLARRLTTVVDATNTLARVRTELAEMGRAVGVPCVAVAVVTPLPVCLARNEARPGPASGARWGRRVPEPTVHAQHAQVMASLPLLRGEGFSRVVVYDGAGTA